MLEDFLIDSNDIDKEQLSLLLKPYLRGIDKNNGSLIFQSRFYQLSAKSRILIYLLSAKAAYLLKKRTSESVPLKELVEKINLPDGTVKGSIFRLRTEGYITASSTESGYTVPNFTLQSITLDAGTDKDYVEDSPINIGGDSTVSLQEKTQLNNIPLSKPKSVKKRSGTSHLVSLPNISREKWEPVYHLLSNRGHYMERALLTIKLAREAGQDGLTPAEIDLFLRETIRTPIDRANLSSYLGNSYPTYTDRTSSGKGFCYKIMKRGEELVDNYISGNNQIGEVPEQPNGTT